MSIEKIRADIKRKQIELGEKVKKIYADIGEKIKAIKEV